MSWGYNHLRSSNLRRRRPCYPATNQQQCALHWHSQVPFKVNSVWLCTQWLLLCITLLPLLPFTSVAWRWLCDSVLSSTAPDKMCRIYTLHGFFFKRSDVSQASQASCFTSAACVTRTSPLSPHDVRTVSRKLIRLVKMSPDSLSSDQILPVFSSPLLISFVQHRLVPWRKSLSFSIVFSRKCIPKLRKVSSLYIQGLFPADWQECVSSLLLSCLHMIYSSFGELNVIHIWYVNRLIFSKTTF